MAKTPQSAPMSGDETERARRFLDATLRIENVYRANLEYIAPKGGGAIERTHLRRLCSPEAMHTLAKIWTSSAFVRPESEPDPQITVYTLALDQWQLSGDGGRLNSSNTHVLRTTRIVDAAVAFGLVERDEVRKNKRVLLGTEALHRLMVSTFAQKLDPDV